MNCSRCNSMSGSTRDQSTQTTLTQTTQATQTIMDQATQKLQVISAGSTESRRRKRKKQPKDDIVEPPHKNIKDGTFEQGEISPAVAFIQKTANMPNIWENILLNMSASNVAILLKVCKGLRTTIGQCLEYNKKLHKEISIAAALSAIKCGKVQSSLEVSFDHTKDEAQSNWFYSIDDVWFYRKADCRNVEILKYNRKCDQISFKQTLPIQQELRAKMSAYPFLDTERFFVSVFLTSALIEINSSSAKLVSSFTSPLCPDTGDVEELQSEGVRNIQPHCIRYKLIRKRKSTTNDFTITLLNTKGEVSMKLPYEIKKTTYYCHHMASNDQAKMLLLMPDLVVIHDTTTGDVLWKMKPEPEDINGLSSSGQTMLFLTREIAGYIVRIYQEQDEEDSVVDDDDDDDQFDLDNWYYMLRIYDTNNGILLSSAKIEETIKIKPRCEQKVIARESFLCYTCYLPRFSDLNIFVIRLKGKELKKYEIYFPVEYFIKHKKISATQHCIEIILLGFLAKTNILIGNLITRNSNYDYPITRNSNYERKHLLFSLNIDAVFRAKNKEEINSAFNIFPTNKPSSEHDDEFKPVYRTNRSTMSVELVGVMRQKDIHHKSEILTIENHYFVTEMQLPSDT